MYRYVIAVLCAFALMGLSHAVVAQQSKPANQPQLVGKASGGVKQCKFKCPSGKVKKWTCKASQPCCAWAVFCYTKCGSKTFGCL